MTGLRIGLLALDGSTLEEVLPLRERLEAMGALVTLLIPSGGSILPVSGRYYPASGGHGIRKSLNYVSSSDFDMLLLPDSITGEKLAQQTQVLEFVRGHSNPGDSVPVPIFKLHYLTSLLDKGSDISGLATLHQEMISPISR